MKDRKEGIPQIARWILGNLSVYSENYSILEDFEDEYGEIAKERGVVRAISWLWVQIILSIGYHIKLTFIWSIAMFRNYLKIALRNLRKYKSYSFINITGLALGMASSILILLWVQDELSYDKFNENIDNLFRIIGTETMSGSKVRAYSVIPSPVSSTLKSEYPEVVNTARFKTLGTRVIQNDDMIFSETGFAFVDPSLFELFTFPFEKGDPETALSDPYSMVISVEMAEKYFGEENPLGQTILVDNRFEFMVTGVMKNIPVNSHMQFHFAVPFEILKEYNRDIDGWGTYAYYIYVLLDNNADYKEFDSKITGIVKENNPGSVMALSLQPVRDINLYSRLITGMGGRGDIKYIYLFSLIAGFILIMACINFMNLTTARSGNRAKEVGMRKVAGAGKKEIMRQFFGESLFISFIALIFAVFLVSLILPSFSTLSGKQLTFNPFKTGPVLFGLILITLITGIISGSYPALFLSTFKPVIVLKGRFSSGSKGSLFRKILVVFQFILTITLVIGTLIIYKQLNFVRNQKLGYDKDHILCLDLKGDLVQRYETLKNELIKNPGVLNVTAGSDMPTYIHASMNLSEWEGKNTDDQFAIDILWWDYNYLKTFGLEMANGRFFSPETVGDESGGLIVNERAVQAMNMESPLGKRVFDIPIIGILKDFHFESLHAPIKPLLIAYSPKEYRYIFIKINSYDVDETINSLETTWKNFARSFPFEFRFLDEHIDNLYRTDRQIGNLITWATVLALFIACLGLFGLASFTAEQRTKEIGIRKVLGASVSGIIILLSREFVKWILIANIIAWPVAYFCMTRLLRVYAYRININILTFILATAFALVVALLTVSIQSIRAALANPVNSIKYE